MKQINKEIRETEKELDQACDKLRSAQRKVGRYTDPEELSDIHAEIALCEFDVAGIKGHLRGLYDRRDHNSFIVGF